MLETNSNQKKRKFLLPVQIAVELRIHENLLKFYLGFTLGIFPCWLRGSVSSHKYNCMGIFVVMIYSRDRNMEQEFL